MKHPFDVHVGARLKLCRRSAGLSRKEFGDRVGVGARDLERMEEGELSLEESLETYERGIALSRACQKSLDAAEQRIRPAGVQVAEGRLVQRRCVHDAAGWSRPWPRSAKRMGRSYSPGYWTAARHLHWLTSFVASWAWIVPPRSRHSPSS